MADDEPPIRVVICDDHPAVRRGLSSFLSMAGDMVVVGAAGDGEEAISLSLQNAPDVVLMDLSLPGDDGVEVTRRIVEALPRTRVLMLSAFGGEPRIRRALAAGAVGYLSKDNKPPEIINAIRAAVRGAGPSTDR